RYDFALYSNFTFFAEDSVNGDQFVQTDHRTIAGFRAGARETREALGLRWNTSVGASLRSDHVANALGPTVERKRTGQTVDARVRQSALGVHVQEDVSVLPWLRLVGGVRADHFVFNVEDRLEDFSDSAVR